MRLNEAWGYLYYEPAVGWYIKTSNYAMLQDDALAVYLKTYEQMTSHQPSDAFYCYPHIRVGFGNKYAFDIDIVEEWSSYFSTYKKSICMLTWKEDKLKEMHD